MKMRDAILAEQLPLPPIPPDLAYQVERDPKWFALAFDLRFGGVKPYTLDVATLAETCGLKRDQLVVRGK